MSDQQYISYSRADIERYLEGRMSVSEMHALERAALQDPFLADAIEGYSDIPAGIAGVHLEEITAALLPTSETARVVPIPASRSRNNRWFRIAAAIIILAGTGTLGWYFIQSPENGPVSNTQVAKTERPLTIKVPPAAPVDSIAPASDAADAVPALKKARELAPVEKTERSTSPLSGDNNVSSIAKQELTSQKSGTPAEIAATNTFDAFAGKNKDSLVIPNEKAGIMARKENPAVVALSGRAAGVVVNNGAQRDLEDVTVVAYGAQRKRSVVPGPQIARAPEASYTLQGVVKDEKGLPVAHATVKPLNELPPVLTDQKGRFSMKSKDSTVNVQLNAIGYDQAQVRIKGRTNQIQLQESEGSLAEVVVTEMSTRKKAFTPAVAAGKDSAYPAGGWQSFQEYVAKKMNKAVDTTGGDQRYDGKEIELEFSLEKDGYPRNVKVIRSSDNSLNDKAIEAVQTGPRWIPGTRKKKARVIVRF